MQCNNYSYEFNCKDKSGSTEERFAKRKSDTVAA